MATRVWPLAVAAPLAIAATYFERSGVIERPASSWFLLVESPLWGLTFFIVINVISFHEHQWRGSGTGKVLALVAKIGLISYSLYLTHELILVPAEKAGLLTPSGFLSPLPQLVVLPIATLVLAWLFFVAVERYFMPGRQDVAPTPIREKAGINDAP
jgi:peptidoglycan/LPS O-acetylase OafA/YrhL